MTRGCRNRYLLAEFQFVLRLRAASIAGLVVMTAVAIAASSRSGTAFAPIRRVAERVQLGRRPPVFNPRDLADRRGLDVERSRGTT